MEDWAEIRRLYLAEGIPIKAIARMRGVSRNAVRRALRAEGPPKYVRPRRGSLADAVEPQVRELLASWPTMPRTVIAERIGWEHSLTVLKDRVRELRPLFTPPGPASRTTYQPGELAQCDLWFPPVDIPLGHGQVGRPPVLVMVSGYSRVMDAVLLPSRAEPGPAGWALAAAAAAGEGPASAGLGQRERGRVVARRPPEAHAGHGGLPRDAGDPGDPVPPWRSGGQGSGRAGQQVPGEQLPVAEGGPGQAPEEQPRTSLPDGLRALRREHRIDAGLAVAGARGPASRALLTRGINDQERRRSCSRCHSHKHY